MFQIWNGKWNVKKETLVDVLYRTNSTISRVCEELGIVFDESLLEDLERCTGCNIWYHSYQLIPDEDDNNICPYCLEYVGR
jgi:hypothetical protein